MPIWMLAVFTCINGCTVRDRIALQTLLLHLSKELQCLSWMLALLAYADGCTVNDHMELQALLQQRSQRTPALSLDV